MPNIRCLHRLAQSRGELTQERTWQLQYEAGGGKDTVKGVLVTGMSGTGKSSVIRELRGMGFRAIDMDEPGLFEHDAEGNQMWCEAQVQAALAAEDGGHIFVSGCADNQVKFYPQFTHIILLSAPADLIRERFAARTNNPYGKKPED